MREPTMILADLAVAARQGRAAVASRDRAAEDAVKERVMSLGLELAGVVLTDVHGIALALGSIAESQRTQASAALETLQLEQRRYGR